MRIQRRGLAREGAFDFLVYLKIRPRFAAQEPTTLSTRGVLWLRTSKGIFRHTYQNTPYNGRTVEQVETTHPTRLARDEGQLHWLDTEEIISSDFQSFIHSPSVGCAWHIREFGYIYTLHIYKNVDLFEPTESEVLAFLVQCVPNQDLRKVLAYKVKQVPGEKINDHHLSYTRLYVPEPWRWLKLLLRRTGWA